MLLVVFIQSTIGRNCFDTAAIQSGIVRNLGTCSVGAGTYNFDDLYIMGGSYDLNLNPNVTINVKNNFKCGDSSNSGTVNLKVSGSLNIYTGLGKQSQYTDTSSQSTSGLQTMNIGNGDERVYVDNTNDDGGWVLFFACRCF